MDLILPDGSEIEGRAYREADDAALIKDNTRFLIPSTEHSTWPERVVGVEGLKARRERSPRPEPASARWATDEEVEALWPVARLASRALPAEPEPDSGIVIVDLG